MIPIYVDLTDLASEFTLTPGEVSALIDRAVKDVAAAIFYNWSDAAKNGLSSTRNRYINSLYVEDVGLYRANVVLDYEDDLVSMIEEGSPPFDQKKGFAASNKVKYNKNGDWYMSIPFRYAASASIGESEVFSGILPPEVYNVALKKETDIPYYSGSRSKGLTIDELPQGFKEPTVRPYIPATDKSPAFEAYKRKTAQFAGLIKVKDNTTGQTSGYTTFRRVGKNSDPMSWVHPGFQKRDFAQTAIDNTDVNQVLDMAIDNFLNKR